MKKLSRLKIRRNRGAKAQATTELAVMGAIIITVLSVLLQQGYLYNCRQALEMYTFRQALKLSRDGIYNESTGKKLPVGVNLTVIRDIFVPSFFTGLNRQTLQATASVEYNPYIMYVPDEESKGKDMPTRQLVQVNDAMIRNNRFIEVPPSLLVVQRKGEAAPEPAWVTSNVSEMDFEADRRSNYTYTTRVKEFKLPGRGKSQKEITKKLTSTDTIYGVIDFQKPEDLAKSYEDEEKGIETISGQTPERIDLFLQETVTREKSDVSKIGR